MGDRGHRHPCPVPQGREDGEAQGSPLAVEATLRSRAGVRRGRTSGLRDRFARLFRGDTLYPDVTSPRLFAFGDESKYAALIVNDSQFKAIDAYETQYGIPVHYLLYHPGHPGQVPRQVELPAVKAVEGDDVVIGARVVPATDLRAALEGRPDKHSPRYSEVKELRPEPWSPDGSDPGWLVEHFVAELAIGCQVGYVAAKEKGEGVWRIFNRRSGPISAAIAVTFDAPPGVDIE